MLPDLSYILEHLESDLLRLIFLTFVAYNLIIINNRFWVAKAPKHFLYRYHQIADYVIIGMFEQ